jgi:hypothetical protein
LYKKVGFGQPASTPPLEEMWAVWRAITAAADKFLGTLTTEQLPTYLEREGKPYPAWGTPTICERPSCLSLAFLHPRVWSRG